MSAHPVELKRTEDRAIEIRWSDGLQQRLTFRQLRDHCPCASCRESGEKPDDAGLRVLAPAETLPLDIVGMTPVGNYAYNIRFSDGHSTGIFTIDLLRSLSQKS
jgi:DUF971 family protein